MGLAILISLGTWQFNRYQEKLESEARRDARAEEAPLELKTLAGSKLEELDYRTLTLTGTLDTSHTVLFKHRQYQKRPGFWLASPLVFEDGTAVMVNRGWVPFKDGPKLAKELSQEPQSGKFTGLFYILPQNIADARTRQALSSGKLSIKGELTQWNSYDVAGVQEAMPHKLPDVPAIPRREPQRLPLPALEHRDLDQALHDLRASHGLQRLLVHHRRGVVAALAGGVFRACRELSKTRGRSRQPKR